MASVTLEEYELLGDPKYRAYVSAVDKALKSFEYTSEWADLISALGKLNKVLLNHLKYPVVPRRIIISKRLAQCLHPALPSGVHLKALETYDIVFKCMGINRLSQELFIFSAGLFPLLGNAAMNVRPALLTIYENHFVPLGERLRPALHGFLTGILNGLDDSSEYHARTSALLESACKGVEPTYFYGCLWECILTNPSVRLPAITFIMNHFNKKQSMEDQLYIMGTNVDVLVQALCAALQDTSILVQRSALDLLLVGFAMHNGQLVREDMEHILTAAIGVVLRRDMSLNRRLYAWLLGTEVNAAFLPAPEKSNDVENQKYNSGNSYFDKYSRELLIQAVKACLKNSRSIYQSTMDLKPYRILISLLDKPEIGAAILDDILIEVFRALFLESVIEERNSSMAAKQNPNNSSSLRNKAVVNNKSELIKTANLLFGTLEPYFIWEYLGELFSEACKTSSLNHHQEKKVKEVGGGDPSVLELFELTEFLLETVSIETYLETQTEHLPNLLCRLTKCLTDHCSTLTSTELTASLQLFSSILAKVQPLLVPPMNDDSSLPSYDQASFNTLDTEMDKLETVSNKSVDSNEKLIAEECEQNDEGEKYTGVQYCSIDHLSHMEHPSGKEFPARNFSSQEDSLHQSLIHTCVQGFKVFFVEFVSQCIFKNIDVCKEAFQELELTVDENEQQSLEEMLWNCLHGDQKAISKATTVQENNKLSPISLECNVNDITTAFALACQILVEFSSFPMYCSYGPQQCNLQLNLSDSAKTFPSWLQLLVTCTTHVVCADLQLAAVGSLLELITITLTVEKEKATKGISGASSPDRRQGTVAVVILPLLDIRHVEFLNKNTRFHQVVAQQLWDHLGDKSSIYHRRSAELLHHLHSLSPIDSLIENVIGASLARGDELMQVEAVRRFSVLWHLTRDLPVKLSPEGTVRMYDRCLFMMLDCLQQKVGPQQAEVQSWLTHSLQHGDIARLLEPILFVLLHPDTARVSVQHVNIHQPQKVNLQELESNSAKSAEAKIYAISSVDGHVFYHVTDEPRCTVSGDSNQRRILALTAITESSSSQVITSSAGFSDFDMPSSHERGVQGPMVLFVNPIGSVSWSDTSESSSIPDLTNVHQFSSLSIKKSSSFDEMEASSASIEPKDYPVESPELTSVEIVNSILEEIVENVVKVDKEYQDIDELVSHNIAVKALGNEVSSLQELTHQTEEVSIHPLHTHLLLYCQVFDSQRVLYAFIALQTILQTNPRLALCTLATASLTNARSPRHNQLHELLARHRRSVFGKGFHGDLPIETITSFRSSMLIEILLSVCLYFIRSFYPNLGQIRLTEEELRGNREVQLAAVDMLTLLLSELVPVVKDSGRGFASYINDLLGKCRIQKALLHCLLSTVYSSGLDKDQKGSTFTETILNFNELPLHQEAVGAISDYSEAFQVYILRLLLVLIILEDQIAAQRNERDTKSEGERTRFSTQNQGSTVRYQQGVPIPSQPMFLTAVLCAMKQQQTRHLHRHWLALITSSLPFLGRAVSQIVITVTNQVCQNIELLATLYQQKESEISSSDNAEATPVDYVMTLLDGLTTLCHYCLLDSPSQVSTVLTQPHFSSIHHPCLPGANAGQILSNLINVFTPSVVKKDPCSAHESSSLDSLIVARRNLLSHLPRIVAALATLWQACQVAQKNGSSNPPCWIMGTPKAVKQKILEFLSPISHHHGNNFMAAIAIAWNEKHKKGQCMILKKVISQSTEEQQDLVDLVSAIKVMPVDILVQTVRHVMKQPPPTNSSTVKAVPLQVSVLQFFYSYVQLMSGSTLLESWSSLLTLLKEGLQLGLVPPAQFLLLGILNEFVQRAPMLEDKKEQKELQDIAQKLIEAVSTVASASLEQTTWLRRNLAVKPGPQPDITDSDTDIDGNFDEASASGDADSKSSLSYATSNNNSHFSVQALSVLAELLAPLLDVIFVSDEKDKVVPLLTSIMANVTPYLRNHSQHNVPSFKACSQLLANLSGYQYTRKSWRRDALDLLLDPSFFQITESCIGFWQITVDNLMTHDKTTFRDLMARVAMAQSGSLNLFSSKEQEYEQRSQLLKRLAFVIFSGEIDQYQNCMPEIQERLSESLRLPQVPYVQAQVFLCFRVLLLRMSSQHITSLWPIIITEMVVVFLQMEQELNADSEEFRQLSSSHIRRMSTLDSSWVVSPNNGLNAHNNPAWLHLYLAVCKLLDLALSLPADQLPQFQMYRWAFVGENIAFPNNNNIENKLDGLKLLPRNAPHNQQFVPHIIRLAHLLNKKVPCTNVIYPERSQPLLIMPSIKSIMELQPFFNALAAKEPIAQSTKLHVAETQHKNSAIEKGILRDFLESLASC